MDNIQTSISLMRQTITGNLNATVVAMAEKIADKIRGRDPLPKSSAPYYVAGDKPARRAHNGK